MSEARIVWANDAATNAARHITEVRTGLACHCVCPGCGAKLEAVNAQNPNWKRRPHFRHYEAPELVDCAQQAVLTGAREALKQAKKIELPELRIKRIIAAQDRMEFAAEVYEPAHRTQIESVEFVDATDAVLTLAGGQQIYVRLVATAKRPGDPKQLHISEVPSQREKVVRQYMAIWPKWDWRAIMTFGESARLQEDSVAVALNAALKRFRFSENNNVVKDAWHYAGIILAMPRNDDSNNLRGH